MDSFYLTVLSIALVFLILVLTFIGILMSRKNVVVFPPMANSCPDGWQISPTDPSSCLIPIEPSGVNIGSIGTVYTSNLPTSDFTTAFKLTPGLNSQNKSINFNVPSWSTQSPGLTTLCAQKKWTTQFGITWDGVSNYNSC